MGRLGVLTAMLAALAWFFLVAAPPAAAFPLTNCTLSVRSYDAKSNLLSMTNQGDEVGATREDPLIVDPEGFVEYFADTGGHSYDNAVYHVEVYGVPTPLRGVIERATSDWNGRLWFTDIFPFSFQGTVYVSGALESNGTAVCSGSAWVKIDGNPLPGIVGGAVLALFGLAGAFWASRGVHPFRGILAGLVFGAGLAILSGASGILPLDQGTPIAEVIGSLIAGLAMGAIDWSNIFRSSPKPQPAQFSPGAMVPPPYPAMPNPWPEPGEPTNPVPTGYAAAAGFVTPPPMPPSLVPPVGSVTANTVAVDTTSSPVAVVPPPAPPVPAQAPPPVETPPAQPGPGLPQLQSWVKWLQPPARAAVDPVFGQAQNILRTGPGTLNVSRQVIDQVLGPKPDVSVKLGDGAILVGDGMLRATPCVENGKLSLSLVNAESSTAEFLTGMVAEGVSAAGQATGGPDVLAPVRWFVDNVNAAVANAGQSVQSVKVTPQGIVVTTGPGNR